MSRIRRRMVVVLVGAMLCTGSVSHGQGFDPLQGKVHRANLGRTGVHLTTGVPSAPTIQWEFQTGGPVRSSPVVVDGVVYIGSNDGRVYALDAATGSMVWSNNTGGKVTGSAAVVSNVVYIASEAGYVYALNASTGTQVWKYKTGTLTASSPAVLNGLVILPKCDAGGSEFINAVGLPVVALSQITGTQVWASSAGPMGIASVATDGTYLYTHGSGCAYGVFSPVNGDQIYAVLYGGMARPWTSMVVSGDRFFAPRGVAGTVHCFQVGAAAKQLWVNSPCPTNLTIQLSVGASYECAIIADIAVTDTQVLVPCVNSNLYAYAVSDGSNTWTFATGGVILGSPSVAAGVVYFGSWDGKLYAVNVADGTLRWQRALGDRVSSSPWPADGAIYVGCDNGKVVALH